VRQRKLPLLLASACNPRACKPLTKAESWAWRPPLTFTTAWFTQAAHAEWHNIVEQLKRHLTTEVQKERKLSEVKGEPRALIREAVRIHRQGLASCPNRYEVMR
jgi:hypothetical protein